MRSHAVLCVCVFVCVCVRYVGMLGGCRSLAAGFRPPDAVGSFKRLLLRNFASAAWRLRMRV